MSSLIQQRHSKPIPHVLGLAQWRCVMELRHLEPVSIWGEFWRGVVFTGRGKLCQREGGSCVCKSVAGAEGKSILCDSSQGIFMFTESAINFQLRNKSIYKM